MLSSGVIFRGFADCAALSVTDIEDVHTLIPILDEEHDAMRLEDKLPKATVEILPLTRKRAPLGEGFQSVDGGVKRLEPTCGVEGRPRVNVCEGFPNSGLRFRGDYYPVLHFSEIPCSLARASTNSRMSWPSPRLACSSPRAMPRRLAISKEHA